MWADKENMCALPVTEHSDVILALLRQKAGRVEWLKFSSAGILEIKDTLE